MRTQLNQQLFSDLSPQVASQTQGGHWQNNRRRPSSIVVRFRYYPGSSEGVGSSTINITNPDFGRGSIVNFPGSGDGINVTNPEVKRGEIDLAN